MSIMTLYFLIRLLTGWMFARAGYMKLVKEKASRAQFFDDLGLKPGSAYAHAVGLIELIGGITLAVGIFTGISGLVLGILAAGAALVKFKNKHALKNDLEFYILWSLVCFYFAMR